MDIVSKIKKIYKKEKVLINDSLIIFVGTMVANVFGYLYQLYMGRSLGPENYGLLGALFSMVYIIGTLFGTIQTSITRFVSEYKAKKQYSKIKTLFSESMIVMFLVGFVFFILFFLFRKDIGAFLNTDKYLSVVLLGVFIWFNFIQIPIFGTLSGMQYFGYYSLGIGLSAFLKVILGIIFIMLGFSINGAIGAIVVSALITNILLFLPLNFINKQKKGDVSYSNIFRYSWPVLWATLAISFIANADLILVKHYFNTVDAGYYAAASFIAKIILFATTALATVMFPKVSELNSKGKDTRGILIKTLLYVTGVSIAAVGFYFISPDFVVWLLYGSKYKISNLIGLFGLAIALYSIVTTFVQYNLAVKKYCFLYFLIPLSTLEIVLIALFHSSLVMVISIIAILMAIIALAFLGYNFKDIFRIGSAQ